MAPRKDSETHLKIGDDNNDDNNGKEMKKRKSK
jgi:hypothetical protein